MQKLSSLTLALLIAVIFSPTAMAQRPQRGGPGGRGGPDGQGGPGGLGGMPGGRPPMNQDGLGGADQNNAFQNNAGQGNGGQNMPTVEQLAAQMLANFDADASGTLDQAELQNALSSLRDMMRNRGGGGQDQGQGNQQAFGGNDQNQRQGGGLRFGAQAEDGNAGGRPPRGPRGGDAGGGGAGNRFGGGGRGR